jgi:sec-independent protein translocase protein TatB
MPSFWDSGFIVLLALLLFGPKKLPVLARQLGKLMADFRRASTEFRTQMEEELRISEQADRQKQIAAIEAAAPKPALDAPAGAGEPHIPPPEPTFASTSDPESDITFDPGPPPPAPLPIASSGELNIMPPATGLPVANSSLSPFLDSIPAVPAPDSAAAHHAETNGTASAGASENGHATNHSIASNSAAPEPARETESRPWMI